MKILTTVTCALVAMSLFTSAYSVELNTGGKGQAEVNREIVIRCQYQLGEFGNVAINMCVESEKQALKELADYPDEVADIVSRCNRVMEKGGWGMIKRCSDMDIAAKSALLDYPERYEQVIAECRGKVGRYGHNEVKKCVDEQVAEPGSDANR
jgi:hypothetical protein